MGLSLAHPWLLLLALLVPVAVAWRRRRATPAVLFAPGALAEGLPRTWRTRLAFLPRALGVLGLALAVVALARPIRRVPVPVATEGIDILLCLDTSSSMRANDLAAERTRLDVAKDAAAQFIAGRPDDRIGLVCFARYPDLRIPPTLDHRALQRALADVALVANEGPEDATGIGTAVARAVQALRRGESKSKVVILLTDGEENVATKDKPGEIAPVHAGQLASDLGVRVYAIAAGLGSRDRAGAWVEIDTRQIRRLAEGTGGRFYEARDAGALADVYTRINELERVAFTEPHYRVEERFQPFLAASLALLLAGFLLRATVLEVLP